MEKKFDKKIMKIFTSRVFYLILGLFLALGVFVVHAAWNSTVSNGQTLTAASWNEIVAKLVELDARPSAGTPTMESRCVTTTDQGTGLNTIETYVRTCLGSNCSGWIPTGGSENDGANCGNARNPDTGTWQPAMLTSDW